MLKAYICSSLKDDNYKYVTGVLKELPLVTHLRPSPGIEGCAVGHRRHHVETDIAMLQYCDEVWVLGRYGRDCSWEIGYAMGLKKTVRILSDASNELLILEDWMLHHGNQVGLLHLHINLHSFKTGVMNSGRYLT